MFYKKKEKLNTKTIWKLIFNRILTLFFLYFNLYSMSAPYFLFFMFENKISTKSKTFMQKIVSPKQSIV